MLSLPGRRALAAVVMTGLVVGGCSKPADDAGTSTATSEPASATTAAASTTAEAATTSAAASTTEAAASEFPVTVENCGFTVNMKEQPSRVVTMNQGATELVLALGAAEQMVGTAYLDDEIDPSVKADYDKIPVLSEKYPSNEALLAVKPDFVVASYSSAFKPEAAGDRDELASLGIQSYLDPFACKDAQYKAKADWESIYGEVTTMGKLLGQNIKATEIVDGMKKEVTTISDAKPGTDKTVFWYDSGTDTPFVGAGKGGPQLILNTVGATNIFADLDGNWSKATWEAVLQANPDYIVLADASWDTADAKKEYLKSHESLKDLDAVKNDKFIVVPFAESTTGVHTVDGAKKVADGLK